MMSAQPSIGNNLCSQLNANNTMENISLVFVQFFFFHFLFICYSKIIRIHFLFRLHIPHGLESDQHLDNKRFSIHKKINGYCYSNASIWWFEDVLEIIVHDFWSYDLITMRNANFIAQHFNFTEANIWKFNIDCDL